MKVRLNPSQSGCSGVVGIAAALLGDIYIAPHQILTCRSTAIDRSVLSSSLGHRIDRTGASGADTLFQKSRVAAQAHHLATDGSPNVVLTGDFTLNQDSGQFLGAMHTTIMKDGDSKDPVIMKSPELDGTPHSSLQTIRQDRRPLLIDGDTGDVTVWENNKLNQHHVSVSLADTNAQLAPGETMTSADVGSLYYLTVHDVPLDGSASRGLDMVVKRNEDSSQEGRIQVSHNMTQKMLHSVPGQEWITNKLVSDPEPVELSVVSRTATLRDQSHTFIETDRQPKLLVHKYEPHKKQDQTRRKMVTLGENDEQWLKRISPKNQPPGRVSVEVRTRTK